MTMQLWVRNLIVGACVASPFLFGCALHYQDLATGQSGIIALGGQAQSQQAATTVPANVHFTCVAVPYGTPVYQVPGDVNRILGPTNDAAAATGITRGGWALVVAVTGIIGWIPASVIQNYDAANPGFHCVTYQDAGGRIVFAVHREGYTPHSQAGRL
jgi:hypothetical protein